MLCGSGSKPERRAAKGARRRGRNLARIAALLSMLGVGPCEPPPKSEADRKAVQRYLHGRLLVDKDAAYGELAHRVAEGFTVKATQLSTEFDFAAWRRKYGESALPLFVVDAGKRLEVITPKSETEPQVGQTLIGLVKEEG